MGYDEGSFKAHGELWGMAVDTADDMLERMGIVHRVCEARALDVVPKTIQRFNQLGDKKMVDILTMIANEEIGHVSSGTRWYHYQCQQRQLDPDKTFIDLLWKYMKGPLKGPFNHEIRLKAGFSAQEMQMIEDMSKGREASNCASARSGHGGKGQGNRVCLAISLPSLGRFSNPVYSDKLHPD